MEQLLKKNQNVLGDVYNDNDFNLAGGMDIDKEFASFAQEEKEAYSAPLNSKEVTKMENSSKSLLEEITSGLKTYGKDKFWRQKPFFVQHNGF